MKKSNSNRKQKQTEQNNQPSNKFGVLSIAVDPRYQGSGIQKSLISEAELYAKNHNFTSMRLERTP